MREMQNREKEALYNWGTPQYEETIERLYQVRHLTVNWKLRSSITTLIIWMLELNDPQAYENFFYNFRLDMDQAAEVKAKKKVRRLYERD